MLFLIFGPPGVGKSTLCEKLSLVDLEEFKTTEERIEYARMYASRPGINIAGAADLNPSNFPEAIFITLVMPEVEYLQRRAVRDVQQSNKKGQASLRIADFLDGMRSFDMQIDCSGTVQKTTDNLMAAIASFCKLYGLEKVFKMSDARLLEKEEIQKETK